MSWYGGTTLSMLFEAENRAHLEQIVEKLWPQYFIVNARIERFANGG